jgi:hypothetical protein
MTSRRYTPFFALFILFFVSGCGTMVPQMQEMWDFKTPDTPDTNYISAGGALEYKIKKKILCELIEATQKIAQDEVLPPDWGVQYILNLQVDESTALNPGVALVTPMHNAITNFKGEYLTGPTTPLATATYPFLSSPQQYSLGLGGTLSSQGTRVDKFGSFWALDKLKIPMKSTCLNDDGTLKPPGQGSSLLLESELGIYTWLHDAMTAEFLSPSSPSDPANKLDFVSYEIKFMVISTGTITPTWKLVRITTPTGSLPLASANRTRTHDLTLTFGPVVRTKPAADPCHCNKQVAEIVEPSLAASNASLASQIGLAVANSLRTLPSQ